VETAEVVHRSGWRVRVVDLAGIVGAAAHGPVDLLHAPLDGQPATLSVAPDGAGNLRLTATRGGPRPRLAALGRDPIGALLARRVAAGDHRAVRVVAGVERVVDQVARRLAPEPGARPVSSDQGQRATVIDPATGLSLLVSAAGPPARTTVEAGVPAGELSAAHLAAVITTLASGSLRAYGERTVELRRVGGAGGVTLDQVGGLPAVVARFREVAASFRHPTAMARWGARRPQGILLYGPPGTGKTMLAHALATEIGATLREIRTPEILDKWLGASERNMKRIFREARRYRTPTVLLFDEFDSVIGYAGAGDDSGSHAVNAVAGIFKQEMNGLVAANPNVIVVATTNFPDRIDDSLIRSGRFDLHIEVGLPDARARAEILAVQLRGLAAAHEVPGFRMFADDVDVVELGARGAGLSGADLREVLRRAQLAKAMAEARTGRVAPPITQAELVEGVDALRAARSGAPSGKPPDGRAGA
jgi:transitional endoplasmic reticulum ATPase